MQACLLYMPFPELQHEVSLLQERLDGQHNVRSAEAAKYYGTSISHYLSELYERDSGKARKAGSILLQQLMNAKQYRGTIWIQVARVMPVHYW